jgi:hypothetical protein
MGANEMGWLCNTAVTERREYYNVLQRKSGDVDWIQLNQDTVQWLAVVNVIMNAWVHKHNFTPRGHVLSPLFDPEIPSFLQFILTLLLKNYWCWR